MNSMKIIGLILMVAAAMGAGMFIGSYYAEPIMAGIVNSQSVQIGELQSFIGDCKADNLAQQKEISSLEIRNTQLEYCFEVYDKAEIKTYADINRFLKCVERVER